MWGSILAQNGSITISQVAICTLVSLFLGLLIACLYMFRNTYTKNFVVTLALLPVLVQSVIMVVNGNLGAGVAVMGAFGLIRFRSVPGTAKQIVTIFFAMSVGLACGMGYVAYATLFAVVVGAVMLLLTLVHFGDAHEKDKVLRVTIPEDLNYTHLFDDLFGRYTTKNALQKVRTTNMGGLYELQYLITLKNPDREKELLDAVRQRNGNLSISCSMPVAARDEL